MDRFWNKVNKTDTCWLWTGCTNGIGYGLIRIDTKLYSTHRFSYELHFGKIPVGIHVLHSCDNPLCVNPEHLFLGNQKDNMRDMMNKGRKYIPYGNNFGIGNRSLTGYHWHIEIIGGEKKRVVTK